MKSDVRISLFPISCLNFSFIQFLLSHSLSSDGRVNFPFKDFLEIFCLSTNYARRFDLDLSFLLTVNWKQLEQQFLHPHLHQLPECSHDCQPTQAAVSRGSHQKILTLWELCLLRFACCCWMLPNMELLDLLWLRWWWRRHGTGNFCDCQGYSSACAPRSRSCTSWAHNLCLESDWQNTQTFHSSERRHKGYVYCHQTRLRSLRFLKQGMLVRTESEGNGQKERSTMTWQARWKCV